MESLKILIVEDSEDHIQAAKAMLKEHDLTIAKDFVSFFSSNDSLSLKYRSHDIDGRPKPNYQKELDLEVTKYDAVLTDIHLPSLCDREGVVEAPTGFLVAFKSLEMGVKYIGLITDESHHSGPLPKAFDMWLHTRVPFQVGSSTVYLECDCACQGMDKNKVEALGLSSAKTYKYKNWKRLLANLMRENENN